VHHLRSEDGPIVLIEPSKAGLLERGRFGQPDRTHLPAWAHPVVANGKLYIRDQGQLLCYDGVAELAGSRASQLVYLDAFLPEDGEAVQDYAGVPPARADGWRIPVPGGPRYFGITDKEDSVWVESRLAMLFHSRLFNGTTTAEAPTRS